MSYTKMTADLDIIQKLADEPNEDDGLTAAELKAKFDEAGNTLKTFVNSLIDELNNAQSGGTSVDVAGMDAGTTMTDATVLAGSDGAGNKKYTIAQIRAAIDALSMKDGGTIEGLVTFEDVNGLRLASPGTDGGYVGLASAETNKLHLYNAIDGDPVQMKGVAAPSDGTDAANKAYVDSKDAEVVTVTQSVGSDGTATYTADKTFAQLMAAYTASRPLQLIFIAPAVYNAPLIIPLIATDETAEFGFATCITVNDVVKTVSVQVANNGSSETWTCSVVKASDSSDAVAALGDQIGDLADLETTDKSNLVKAVNEVKTQAEAGGDAVKYTKQVLTSAQQEQARGNIDADQSTYIISVTKDTDGNYSFTGNHATLKDVAIMSKAGRRCILIVNTAEHQKLTYTLTEVLWETGEYNVELANFVASYPYNGNPVMDVITWKAQGDTLTNTNILIPIGKIEGFMQSAINPLMVYRGSFNYWYINGGSIWYTQIVASPASYPVLYVQDEYGNLPLYLSEITDTEVLYKNIASDGSWVGFKVSASGSAPSQSGLISGSGGSGGASHVFTTIESVEDGDGNLTYTSSKTFDELQTALAAGAVIFALYNGEFIPIRVVGDSVIIFINPSVANAPDTQIIISADNTVRVMEIPKSEGIMMALRNDGNVGTEVSSTSTNDELATAKAVYDAITAAIGNIDTLVGTGEVTT